MSGAAGLTCLSAWRTTCWAAALDAKRPTKPVSQHVNSIVSEEG